MGCWRAEGPAACPLTWKGWRRGRPYSVLTRCMPRASPCSCRSAARCSWWREQPQQQQPSAAAAPPSFELLCPLAHAARSSRLWRAGWRFLPSKCVMHTRQRLAVSSAVIRERLEGLGAYHAYMCGYVQFCSGHLGLSCACAAPPHAWHPRVPRQVACTSYAYRHAEFQTSSPRQLAGNSRLEPSERRLSSLPWSLCRLASPVILPLHFRIAAVTVA